MMSVRIPPHDLSVCMVKDMIPGELFNPQSPPKPSETSKYENVSNRFFQDFRMIAMTMAAMTIIAPPRFLDLAPAGLVITLASGTR